MHLGYAKNGESNRKTEQGTKASEHVVEGGPCRSCLVLCLSLVESVAEVAVFRRWQKYLVFVSARVCPAIGKYWGIDVENIIFVDKLI